MSKKSKPQKVDGLHLWNRMALDEMHLNKHLPAMTLVRTTGSGKTRLQTGFIYETRPDLVFVLAPTTSLIGQLYSEFRKILGESYSYMVVASKDMANKKDQSGVAACDEEDEDCEDEDAAEAIITIRDEVEVTTDGHDVLRKIRDSKNTPTIIFCVYNSFHLTVTKALKASKVTADLVICDEAHRTSVAGDDSMYAAIHDTSLPIAHRQFYTATPSIFDIDPGKNVRNLVLHSMDDESKYGPKIATLTMNQAIAIGAVAPFELIVTMTDDADVLRMMGTSTDKIVKLGRGEFTSKEVIAAVALLKVAINGTSTLTFSKSVAKAKNLMLALRVFGNELGRQLEMRTVSAKSNPDERNEALDMLKIKSAAVSNIVTQCKLWTEGIDIQSLDMVAFMDPSKSSIFFMQATGRVTRLNPADPGKLGKVFLPIIIPVGVDGNDHISEDGDGYKEIRDMAIHIVNLDVPLERIVVALKSDKESCECGGGGCHMCEKINPDDLFDPEDDDSEELSADDIAAILAGLGNDTDDDSVISDPNSMNPGVPMSNNTAKGIGVTIEVPKGIDVERFTKNLESAIVSIKGQKPNESVFSRMLKAAQKRAA